MSTASWHELTLKQSESVSWMIENPAIEKWVKNIRIMHIEWNAREKNVWNPDGKNTVND